MEVFTCKFGTIKYKKPSVPDVLKIMKSTNTFERIAQGDDLSVQAEILERIPFLIKEVSIKIGKKKIIKYDNLLDHFEMMEPLCELSGDIIRQLDKIANGSEVSGKKP